MFVERLAIEEVNIRNKGVSGLVRASTEKKQYFRMRNLSGKEDRNGFAAYTLLSI